MSSIFKYYDRIFADKDYAREAERVLGVLRRLADQPVRRILDVGCGTGRHARAFAKLGVSVQGIDLDSSAIEVANRGANPDGAPFGFACCPIGALRARDFDGAVSLFNVVNYITDRAELLSFLSAIRERIRPGRALVFDCWNGVAALLAPPRDKETRVDTGDGHIEVKLVPKLDRMAQFVEMTMSVTVERGGVTVDRPTHTYEHRLWTPRDLREALVQSGFREPRVSKWMDPEATASHDDWKIMFAAMRT